jgi:hypothetical protein
MGVSFIYPNDNCASVSIRERNNLFGNIVTCDPAYAKLIAHPSIRLTVASR